MNKEKRGRQSSVGSTGFPYPFGELMIFAFEMIQVRLKKYSRQFVPVFGSVQICMTQ
jgi:hypothetical protein